MIYDTLTVTVGGNTNHNSYLAVRKSAAALDDEGWGGQVEMVPDGQDWEMSAAEFWRNWELKPFWSQTFLIGKYRTDTKAVRKNLEIRSNWQTFTPYLTREQGSGEFIQSDLNNISPVEYSTFQNCPKIFNVKYTEYYHELLF